MNNDRPVIGHKHFRPYDFFMQGLCWLLSAVSVFMLGTILVFLLVKGLGLVNWNLLTHNYKSETIMTVIEEGEPGDFAKPEDLPEDSYFSSKYGIALKDTLDKNKAAVMVVVHLDENSPFQESKITTAGALQGTVRAPEVGLTIKKIDILKEDGSKGHVGPLARTNAEESVRIMDEESSSVVGYFGLTQGGGIRGSLIAGLMLIAMTLVIVLPIGIAAAVWLHELAPKNKWTQMIRSSVDMLSGVPSIVFGLMGMTMLYPLTGLMGITGQSIVLGALTMSVILLPLVIRQTEESLKTVPVAARMGSLSLGASDTQTIWKVVLPQAMPGIITACLLSISRIIGESAALVYTMGTAVSDYPSYDKGATSPALMIWKVMSGEQPDFELASAISLVILLIVFILNIATRIIMNRISKPKKAKDGKKAPRKAVKAEA